MKNNTKKSIFILALLSCFVFGASAQAEELQTVAKQAILFDAETGMVLFEKNADERMPTSSMSKVLTGIVVFDALKDGRVKLDDTFQVSEKAWRMEGSKMFIKVGTDVKVEDLIRGVVVQSGNDATVALAEGVGGSEADFATMLNKKAEEIGMTNSHFVNASGWPDPNHYSTARDLFKMAKYLIDTYPEYYHYYSEKEFTYNDIKQGNRNPLLYKNIGADGIKTGHTEDAGYGLVASADRNGRRLFLVVNGLDSMNTRASESERLITWGYNQFKNVRLFTAGDVVDEANVWLGVNQKVPLVVAEDMVMSIPVTQSKKIEAKLIYQNPIPAPIFKGDKVGTVEVTLADDTKIIKDVFAGADSAQKGFFSRTMDKIKYTALGHN